VVIILPIKIYAVGDVHGLRYFNIFLASLKSLINSRPNLIIFAGDMIDSGNVRELRFIVDAVKFRFNDVPIIAVFGNEEYQEVEEKLIKEYPEITWLNDSPTVLYIDNVRIGIVGSRGSLEKLTYWQSRNKPILEKVYKERVLIIKKLINEVKKVSDISIYVSHYAPTFITVKGEPDRILPFMGSRDMENTIKEAKPSIAIHAHAHNSKVLEAVIDGVKVYNVSLPARRGVTVINLTPPLKT
jgi:Icc-related predicted phosphoesterase